MPNLNPFSSDGKKDKSISERFLDGIGSVGGMIASAMLFLGAFVGELATAGGQIGDALAANPMVVANIGNLTLSWAAIAGKIPLGANQAAGIMVLFLTIGAMVKY